MSDAAAGRKPGGQDMTDEAMCALSRRRGRWNWSMSVLAAVAIGTAGCGSSTASSVAKTGVRPSMMAEKVSFWNGLTSQQRAELAGDCRSQYASSSDHDFVERGEAGAYKAYLAQIMSITPPAIAERVTHIYAEGENTDTIGEVCKMSLEKLLAPLEKQTVEDREKQEKTSQEQKEQREEAIKTRVEHGTFKATPSNIRAWVAQESIGEGVRSIGCGSQSCVVKIDDHRPGGGVVAKLLGVESTPVEELAGTQEKVFKALFADHGLQEATVESWVEVATTGGKGIKWPVLRVSCDRAAANQINWEGVTAHGLEQLCSLKTLPQGSPP